LRQDLTNQIKYDIIYIENKNWIQKQFLFSYFLSWKGDFNV
jgi:hypothetical protein